MRQIKDASNELQQEIKKSGVDLKNDLNLSNLVQDTVREVEQPLDQAAVEIENSIRFEPPRNAQIVETIPMQAQADTAKESASNDTDVSQTTGDLSKDKDKE